MLGIAVRLYLPGLVLVVSMEDHGASTKEGLMTSLAENLLNTTKVNPSLDFNLLNQSKLNKGLEEFNTSFQSYAELLCMFKWKKYDTRKYE